MANDKNVIDKWEDKVNQQAEKDQKAMEEAQEDIQETLKNAQNERNKNQ